MIQQSYYLNDNGLILLRIYSKYTNPLKHGNDITKVEIQKHFCLL